MDNNYKKQKFLKSSIKFRKMLKESEMTFEEFLKESEKIKEEIVDEWFLNPIR